MQGMMAGLGVSERAAPPEGCDGVTNSREGWKRVRGCPSLSAGVFTYPYASVFSAYTSIVVILQQYEHS